MSSYNNKDVVFCNDITNDHDSDVWVWHSFSFINWKQYKCRTYVIACIMVWTNSYIQLFSVVFRVAVVMYAVGLHMYVWYSTLVAYLPVRYITPVMHTCILLVREHVCTDRTHVTEKSNVYFKVLIHKAYRAN